MIPKFVRKLYISLLRQNPLIYNTLQFGQYSRLAIRLNIFRFSANNSKAVLKFEKAFH